MDRHLTQTWRNIMGRGNWYPGSDLDKCRVVYLDYSDDDIEPDDHDRWQWSWDDVKAVIAASLPKSFIMVDDYRDIPHHIRQTHWRNSGVLAYNGLFTLWADTQGDVHHLGIGFTVNDEAPSFAATSLDLVADKFFDKLSESYDLSVRKSAWTDAKYRRTQSA